MDMRIYVYIYLYSHMCILIQMHIYIYIYVYFIYMINSDSFLFNVLHINHLKSIPSRGKSCDNIRRQPTHRSQYLQAGAGGRRAGIWPDYFHRYYELIFICVHIFLCESI
jgi:hypothetical protein